MRLLVVTFFLSFLLSCKSTTYFIVRHAEKEGGANMAMTSDPPLTTEGTKQALDLKNYLQDKNIATVYTTNYARTVATAEPTRQLFGLNLKMYDPRKNDELISALKEVSKGNVLVVGHSNTVDDVVNGLMGTTQMTDLADTEYGHVFMVKRKGSTYRFERVVVPKTTPR